MDPFISKIQSSRVQGHFLVRKLGEGGYGSVWIGQHVDTGKQVAIKLDSGHDSLGEEYEAYQPLQGQPGFPEVHWCGWIDRFGVLILELLGPSLADLFEFCGRQFSLKTIILIADQLIQRLETLHSTGYVHRDLKPQNFLLGTGAKGNLIHMTDFGLAKAFRPGRGKESQSIRRKLVGTARYASVNAHYGRPLCAKDELESLGYVLIYFARGRLPWQGLASSNTEEEYDQVLEKKLGLSIEDLCSGLPETFVEYMNYVHSCTYDQTPDYQKLRSMFHTLAQQECIEYDNIYDWTYRMFLHQTQQVGEQLNAEASPNV